MCGQSEDMQSKTLFFCLKLHLYIFHVLSLSVLFPSAAVKWGVDGPRLCTEALQLKTCILFLHLLCSEDVFVVASFFTLFLSLGLYCTEFIFQIVIHLW